MNEQQRAKAQRLADWWETCEIHDEYEASVEMVAFLRTLAASAENETIDLVLHCPKCGMQHVDEATEAWGNPPHRSHLCIGCGHVWRPADVATNGVRAVQTKGRADIPIANPPAAQVPAGWKLVPVEPTPDMEAAGAKAARQYMEETGGNSVAVICRAMLAAAPEAKA